MELELASTITLVLQSNRLTKCASHPEITSLAISSIFAKFFFIPFIIYFPFSLLLPEWYQLCAYSLIYFLFFSSIFFLADLITLILFIIMILCEKFCSYPFVNAYRNILLKIIGDSIYFSSCKIDLSSVATLYISELLSIGRSSSELILNFHNFFITVISIIIFCFNSIFLALSNNVHILLTHYYLLFH